MGKKKGNNKAPPAAEKEHAPAEEVKAEETNVDAAAIAKAPPAVIRSFQTRIPSLTFLL